jgi:hypothetical protein
LIPLLQAYLNETYKKGNCLTLSGILPSDIEIAVRIGKGARESLQKAGFLGALTSFNLAQIHAVLRRRGERKCIVGNK